MINSLTEKTFSKMQKSNIQNARLNKCQVRPFDLIVLIIQDHTQITIDWTACQNFLVKMRLSWSAWSLVGIFAYQLVLRGLIYFLANGPPILDTSIDMNSTLYTKSFTIFICVDHIVLSKILSPYKCKKQYLILHGLTFSCINMREEITRRACSLMEAQVIIFVSWFIRGCWFVLSHLPNQMNFFFIKAIGPHKLQIIDTQSIQKD